MRFAPRVSSRAVRLRIPYIASVVSTLVDDYAQTGIGTFRVLALVDQHPNLSQVTDGVRTYHRGWVAEALAPQLAGRPAADRDRTVSLLVTVLDVRTCWRNPRAREFLRERMPHSEPLLYAAS